MGFFYIPSTNDAIPKYQVHVAKVFAIFYIQYFPINSIIHELSFELQWGNNGLFLLIHYWSCPRIITLIYYFV